MTITKDIVYSENGEPKAVLIPWEKFQEIEKLLGSDLEPEVEEILKQAKVDRSDSDNYGSFDDI